LEVEGAVHASLRFAGRSAAIEAEGTGRLIVYQQVFAQEVHVPDSVKQTPSLVNDSEISIHGRESLPRC